MWARSATAPHRVVSQAQALLMAGDGVANSRIATALGISRPTVLDWRARFRTEGPVGALLASTGPAASTGQPATGLIRVPQK